MTTSPRFVTVTNTSNKIITLYPDFPRSKKDDPVEIKLAPREKSRPLPYDLLSGTTGWQALFSGGSILLEDVTWTPTMVNIKNLSDQMMSIEVKLPRPKKRGTATKSRAGLRKRYKVRPQRFSPRLSVDSIVKVGLGPSGRNKPLKVELDLESLIRDGALEMKPVPYIGPPVANPPCVGSFGNDDVYLCYGCGQPIVIRYQPPQPIHI